MSSYFRSTFTSLSVTIFVAIGLACGSGSDVQNPKSQITVKEIINEVETDRPRGSQSTVPKFQDAVLGQELISGDSIKTFQDSEVRVDVVIKDHLRVTRSKPGTVWRLGRFAIEGNTIIELDRGKLFVIDEGFREGEPDFEIVTPIGVAAARGTWMAVEYDPDSGVLEALCFRKSCELSNTFGTVLLADEQKSMLTARSGPTDAFLWIEAIFRNFWIFLRL